LQEFPKGPVGEILIWVSWPGFQWQNWIIAGVIVAFMFAMRWFPEAIFTALASLGGMTAELVKSFIDRPRPPADLAVQVLNSYSFPSGHVTSYVALFGFLFYLAFTLLPLRSVFKWIVMIICAALILLIGPSRVYMGQHWASDAIAGYALGFTYLLIIVELYRFWMKRHPKAPAPQSPQQPPP
jgi:undecaprenyl-diphosphatase